MTERTRIELTEASAGQAIDAAAPGDRSAAASLELGTVNEVAPDVHTAREQLTELRDSLRDRPVTMELEAFRPLWLNGDYSVQSTVTSKDLKDAKGDPVPNQLRFMDREVHIAILDEASPPDVYALFRTARDLDAELEALQR